MQKLTASEKLKIMKTRFHERQKKSIPGVGKKLFILTAAVIASSFIATKGYSQVFVSAHFGVRVPVPHVYVGAAYAAPAPVYQQEPVYAPAPAYDGGYYAAPNVCEAEYPGYAYYDYPAWCGHYRDRVYFEHYRPFFYRDHAAYFYHGGFDHDRWGRDHGWGHEREWDHDHGWGHDHDRGRHEGWGDHDRRW